jgi:hypothetical protein
MTPPVSLDAVADPRRDETRCQKAERHSCDHPCKGPSGIAGDWFGEHGEQIIGGAPGEDLRHAEHRNDDA